MPTVSVIVPTYGHRDFVLETLDSVFAQTFTDVEVIVLNDGSPDDTAAVLKPLANAGRIRYVGQANAGQSATRNRGLGLATGEFVAFLDDDDLWPPDKLAWQVAVLRSGDAVAVGGGLRTLTDGRLEDANNRPFPPTLRPVDFYGRIAFFSPGQVLMRTSAVRAIGGFDASIWGADDLDLYLRLSAAGPFLYDPRVALLYRKHASNASRAWERMLVNGRKALANNLTLVPEAARGRAAAAGEQFLYLCYGSDRLQDVWSLRPRRWRDAARAVAHFVKPALRQPRLGVGMARDLVPRPVRRMLRPAPDPHA